MPASAGDPAGLPARTSSGRSGVTSPKGPVDERAAGPARLAAARTGPGRAFGDAGPFSRPGETPTIAEPPLPMPRHGEDRARESRGRVMRDCSARDLNQDQHVRTYHSIECRYDGTTVDLCGKEQKYPDLVSKTKTGYPFC